MRNIINKILIAIGILGALSMQVFGNEIQLEESKTCKYYMDDTYKCWEDNEKENEKETFNQDNKDLPLNQYMNERGSFCDYHGRK